MKHYTIGLLLMASIIILGDTIYATLTDTLLANLQLTTELKSYRVFIANDTPTALNIKLRLKNCSDVTKTVEACEIVSFTLSIHTCFVQAVEIQDTNGNTLATICYRELDAENTRFGDLLVVEGSQSAGFAVTLTSLFNVDGQYYPLTVKSSATASYPFFSCVSSNT
ncbi:MAG TPA: hypothetical protein VHA52_08625 [Candidatus Babeliaceae bacterium]|nr:hypothetical protein [Candidatus Babeliaceae bacterium]